MHAIKERCKSIQLFPNSASGGVTNSNSSAYLVLLYISANIDDLKTKHNIKNTLNHLQLLFS